MTRRVGSGTKMGNTKIGEFVGIRGISWGPEDVGGFDIPVDDALTV